MARVHQCERLRGASLLLQRNGLFDDEIRLVGISLVAPTGVAPEEFVALERLAHVDAAAQCDFAAGHHFEQRLSLSEGFFVALLLHEQAQPVGRHVFIGGGEASGVVRAGHHGAAPVEVACGGELAQMTQYGDLSRHRGGPLFVVGRHQVERPLQIHVGLGPLLRLHGVCAHAEHQRGVFLRDVSVVGIDRVELFQHAIGGLLVARLRVEPVELQQQRCRAAFQTHGFAEVDVGVVVVAPREGGVDEIVERVAVAGGGVESSVGLIGVVHAGVRGQILQQLVGEMLLSVALGEHDGLSVESLSGEDADALVDEEAAAGEVYQRAVDGAQGVVVFADALIEVDEFEVVFEVLRVQVEPLLQVVDGLGGVAALEHFVPRGAVALAQFGGKGAVVGVDLGQTPQ